ncbi:hypothetical protein FOQG_17635 [Fusarium oxysporum f. sp. raphani 54005]|uniref:Uncharacterized protein n=2 Tax=Fusarium oxysporum f. sp. raphani TaxID=96318 RepID=X0C4L2_FUSOX|nr:hypothetical protein FOQG_17635 [Fusarium oxysporum f. sp. raphani 54005]KAG7414953.1 hypothetical protein Forpi1262_v016830 [Fusarium oxysporum f. sp. raphani]
MSIIWIGQEAPISFEEGEPAVDIKGKENSTIITSGNKNHEHLRQPDSEVTGGAQKYQRLLSYRGQAYEHLVQQNQTHEKSIAYYCRMLFESIKEWSEFQLWPESVASESEGEEEDATAPSIENINIRLWQNRSNRFMVPETDKVRLLGPEDEKYEPYVVV